MREKSKGLDESKNDQSATDAGGNRSSRTEDDDEDFSIGSITGKRMNVTEQMKRSQPYIMALLAGKSPTLRSPLGSLSQVTQLASPIGNAPIFALSYPPLIFPNTA